MAACVSSMNGNYKVDDVDFDLEVSESDMNVLMSLLYEINEEEAASTEDERLRSVMRSLEAEIDPHQKFIIDIPSTSDTENYGPEEEDQQDCSLSASESSSNMDNFDWINDMEMEYSSISTPGSDDDNNMGMDWYINEAFTNEIEVRMIQFADSSDYSSQFCYEGDNNSLWEGTY